MAEGNNLVDYHGCDFFPERCRPRPVVDRRLCSDLGSGRSHCDHASSDRCASGRMDAQKSARTLVLAPCRWFDLVVVLMADNTVLYERLEKRGYEQKKISENVQCEIMQVIAEEARESYRYVCNVACLDLKVHPVLANMPHYLKHAELLIRARGASCCREEVVQYLPSNTIDDIESNVEKIVMWVKACKHR